MLINDIIFFNFYFFKSDHYIGIALKNLTFVYKITNNLLQTVKN